MNVKSWSICVATCLLFAVSGPVQAGQSSQAHGLLLQKSADVRAPSSAAGVGRHGEIVVRLDRLQPADLINIRTSGHQVSAAAGALTKAARLLQGNVPTEAIEPAQPPDESALTVTSDAITFVRAAPIHEMLFLDIIVPEGARIRVLADGKTLLRASLKNPLSLYNGEWFQGVSSLAAIASRAGLAAAGYSGAVKHFRDAGTGEHRGVSFSDLQVLENPWPKVAVPQTVLVALEVDETGHVVDVIPITDAPPEVQKTLRSWRFAPYLVDGSPASVSTVAKLVFR